MTGTSLPGATPVNVTGVVQGLVIGDHNTVEINVVKHEAYVAREAPALPAHWIERADLLARAAAVAGGGVVALVGMGGTGKSALAGRVAAETAQAFPDGCFWIDLAAEEGEESLARIARAFGHDITALDTKDRPRIVRSLLTRRRVLLVLDDAWSVESTDLFLPPPAGCAALVTTRNEAVATAVATDVIAVDSLEREHAAAMLARVFGTQDAMPDLAGLAEMLGGLPLALELAGKLARKQARRPGFAWDAFAASFATPAQRLGLGLADASVRAAFDTTWTRALDAPRQRAFALLGLFEPGEISTAEAAAAWHAAADAARTILDDLVDLSLIRFVDKVTVQLHPLLADYAQEKARELAEDERIAAHRRIADHLFERAPRPPRTLADLRYVLRSHIHACSAGDRERAGRVYPWFREGQALTSVPAFLIDRGQVRTRVRHARLELALAGDLPAITRSWYMFWLAEALMGAAAFTEAHDHMRDALAIMEGPEADDDERALGLSKFLLYAGQIHVAVGDDVAAEAAYRRAVEYDRKLAADGTVHGAAGRALITMLQLGDLLERRGDGSGAVKIFFDALEEAKAIGEADVAVMAEDRLARMTAQTEPPYALNRIREARAIVAVAPRAFAGRQGARYARQLADTAANLAFAGEDAIDDSLALLAIAIRSAGQVDAQQELAASLYKLGNVLEHFHLLDREAPLAAAWAAYALADRFTQETEAMATNGAQRIELRIAPRMTEAQRATAAAAVEADPWGLLDAALAPTSIGWRPDDATHSPD